MVTWWRSYIKVAYNRKSLYTYETVFNDIASVTDPLGRTTTFGFDSKGNAISVANLLGNQASFSYNSSGQVISATDPLQHTTAFSYDQGDLVSTTDPLGRIVRRFLDSAGRTLIEIDPLGRTVRYEYDALDRVTRIIDPQGDVTQFSYDANSNLLSITDPRGKITSYTYDNMDRLVTRTDPLMRVESFEYDLMGNLTKSTDRRGKVTSFTYDSLDRLVFTGYGTVVNGGTTTYESTTSFTYDGASCGCGGADRLTQMVDSISGTINYTYDNLDRLTSETTPQGTISYSYDAAGRQTSKTVGGQSTINYTFDNADRLTQISQGSSTVSFAYDADGRETSMTLPNGVVAEYGYDAASQLISLTYRKGGNVLGNLTYEYDLAGQTTKMGGSFARMNLPQVVSTTNYDSANQMTAFGAQALTYDNNGNLTSDGVNTYTWDARNQLVSISGPGMSASFQYDALGRRVSKTINGATKEFLYDGANIVQEKTSGAVSGNILSGGIDEFFTRADASGSWNPLVDRLGSVLAMTDSSGNVQTEYTYEPFGKTAVSGATNSNAQKYTGREDDSTGLYYYRARYYTPTLQRFISEDPIGFDGGMNFYSYVGDDPINFTDPLGLHRILRRIPLKRWKSDPKKPFSRIHGGIPFCSDDDDCEDIMGAILHLSNSIFWREAWKEMRGHGREVDEVHRDRIQAEDGELINCMLIFAEKVNRGECGCTWRQRDAYEKVRRQYRGRGLQPLNPPPGFKFKWPEFRFPVPRTHPGSGRPGWVF